MIPYEPYKLIHILSLFLFILLTGISFYAPNSKAKKIGIGVCTFLIFLGGMGMMARLGISHTSSYPTWIVIKMIAWLAVAISAPVLIKRFQHKKVFALTWILSLISIAAYTAIFKL